MLFTAGQDIIEDGNYHLVFKAVDTQRWRQHRNPKAFGLLQLLPSGQLLESGDRAFEICAG